MEIVSHINPVAPQELRLDKAQRGRSYLIIENSATGRDRIHMDSLGLIVGDVVHVLFCNYAGLVVAIKGSRLALGRSLAACLTVHEFEDNAWPADASA